MVERFIHKRLPSSWNWPEFGKARFHSIFRQIPTFSCVFDNRFPQAIIYTNGQRGQPVVISWRHPICFLYIFPLTCPWHVARRPMPRCSKHSLVSSFSWLSYFSDDTTVDKLASKTSPHACRRVSGGDVQGVLRDPFYQFLTFIISRTF